MVVVLPKPAQRGDVELEVCGSCDFEARPGNRRGAQDVTVGKREHATVDRSTQPDEFESSGVDLRGSLAPRASVFEELPLGVPFGDRLGGDAFVLAVIHLAQKRRQARIGIARKLGGAHGTLKRAGEDCVEAQAAQAPAQRPRLGLADWREGEVGAARVAAVAAPLRLAVPGEIDFERQAGLPIISGRPERSERLALSMTAPARTRWPGRMHTRPTAA